MPTGSCRTTRIRRSSGGDYGEPEGERSQPDAESQIEQSPTTTSRFACPRRGIQTLAGTDRLTNLLNDKLKRPAVTSQRPCPNPRESADGFDSLILTAPQRCGMLGTITNAPKNEEDWRDRAERLRQRLDVPQAGHCRPYCPCSTTG